MSPTAADILAVVTAAPGGLTTREIAERCNSPLYAVQGKVSKLAAYGHLDKLDTEKRGTARWKAKGER